MIRAAIISIAIASGAHAQQPLTRAHCEALRDGIRAHAELVEAGARVAQSAALEGLMVRDDVMAGTRREIDAMGEIVKRPALRPAAEAWAAICAAQ